MSKWSWIQIPDGIDSEFPFHNWSHESVSYGNKLSDNQVPSTVVTE